MLDSYLKKKKKEGKYFSPKSRGFESKNKVLCQIFRLIIGCHAIHFIITQIHFIITQIEFIIT